MNVLIVGSGGREHALAWKIAQSPRLRQLWIAPGNGGTERLGIAGGNVPIAAEHVPALLDFALEHRVDLTVIGPEAPLALGIVDAFRERGLAAFGPSQAAARVETSKAFAKEFMRRHGIPTARYAIFDSYDEAVDYVRRVDYAVVLKASGLAGGKGVLLPQDRHEAEKMLHQLMVERVFGDAGAQVVIEERLSGPEVSVLSFADGYTATPMPPAQDYKRAFDGDRGPNTGGMGAYAPAPMAPPPLVEEVRRTILQPALDGLRAEGTPYVGVLYAGLILTDAGPRVLEFNCRFGDPEAQVILPLLETDLLEVMEACLEQRLHRMHLSWQPAAAVTVVLASAGYPGPYEKGRVIRGLENAEKMENIVIFHAGTRRNASQVLTNGGRVLNVTAVDHTLEAAIRRAYAAVEKIHFEGMHYRRDIGMAALAKERVEG